MSVTTKHTDPYQNGSLKELPSYSRDTTSLRLRGILRLLKRNQKPVLVLEQLRPCAVLITYQQFLSVRHVLNDNRTQ